ncbi:hypothetical protein BDZ91DRAFT_766087 [Kalaharituber pfeilii]|nr:hypothetical protein BDZ91DRAFT_766087 [Kalaharituber pfeilii]
MPMALVGGPSQGVDYYNTSTHSQASLQTERQQHSHASKSTDPSQHMVLYLYFGVNWGTVWNLGVNFIVTGRLKRQGTTDPLMQCLDREDLRRSSNSETYCGEDPVYCTRTYISTKDDIEAISKGDPCHRPIATIDQRYSRRYMEDWLGQLEIGKHTFIFNSDRSRNESSGAGFGFKNPEGVTWNLPVEKLQVANTATAPSEGWWKSGCGFLKGHQNALKSDRHPTIPSGGQGIARISVEREGIWQKVRRQQRKSNYLVGAARGTRQLNSALDSIRCDRGKKDIKEKESELERLDTIGIDCTLKIYKRSHSQLGVVLTPVANQNEGIAYH